MAEEIKSGTQSSAQKKQPPLWKEVSDMSDKEQMSMLIDIYTDLQRIKSAEDRDKESTTRLKRQKRRSEAFGVVTENLDIH